VLTNFLRENKNIFAWKPADMLGVPRELAEHKLDLNPGSKPVKQCLRWFSPDKKAAIKKEITKLLAVGFIREILHPDWLANQVHVQKKNSTEWCMCVDYIDLNKHYPKDPFGLPRIDQIVDFTAGSAFLSFLDCYSGYHQIALQKEDQSKTSFITLFGTYYYTTMSFGLKKHRGNLSAGHPSMPKQTDRS